MHSISSRYRKPKGRMNNRRKAGIENARKRYLCNSANQINDSTIGNSNTECLNIQPNDNMIASTSQNINEHAMQSPAFSIVHESAWVSLLQKVPCSECNTSNCLQIEVGKSFGYSIKLELICKNCKHSYGTTYSSTRMSGGGQFEINKKLVDAFLSIGKGHAALETFSMVLGMKSMDKKTFSKCLDNLSDNNFLMRENVLSTSRDLVRKAHMELNSTLGVNDMLDITVSYDGTWQKRGHTSLYGIGTVIDTITGLVVDYEILSKYCHECVVTAHDLHQNSAEFAFWYEGHKPNCQKNFDGSSCSMEMCAALAIWNRSVKHNMRYTTVLSDGDAKTYQQLVKNSVYGPNVSIEKEECINHVAKRLGTALRNKVKEWRSKGVTLGGRKRGNLKDETITKLQNFYQKAIKDNAPDIQSMRNSIFATLYHCMSTDKKPQHNKCPKGIKSWCFYQRAIASGETPQSHKFMKTYLSEAVVEKILPVYQRLASQEILSRCASAKTQNANESFHSCIWKKCPKEVFVSKKRLDLAVVSAISEFNLGCAESLKMTENELCCNANSLAIAEKRDSRRKTQKERRSAPSYKAEAIKKKFTKRQSSASKIKKEGVTYAAGSF